MACHLLSWTHRKELRQDEQYLLTSQRPVACGVGLCRRMEGRLVVIIASALRAGKSRARTSRIRAWSVWALPRRALTFLIAIEGLAVTLTVVELVHGHAGRSDLARFALLAALSVLHAEVEDRTDRIRRSRAVDAPYIDATSVWTFAAVLVLPAGLAALLVMLIYGHTIIRVRRNRSGQPHRSVFSGAAVVLSVLAAKATDSTLSQIAHIPTGAAQVMGVIGALVVYRLVNDGAITAVLYLTTRPASMSDTMLKADDLAVEIATMILGAFTAQTIIQMPWLTPAVLVLVVMMYRGLLVKKLEVAATTDGKTELLNATAWRELAQRHLWRAIREQQAAALLVIDLDRFKALNDEHGHLAGDVALKAVADRIKHELRDYDAVGRYGGEEFVALLPNAGANAAMRVAERVRARIEDEPIMTDDGLTLSLTGSVGVATYPPHGSELDALIRAADRAMYAAKDAGRNTVRLAAPSPTSHESQPASA